MKKIMTLLLVVVGIVVLSACERGKKEKIGFAASTFQNPFFNEVKKGIEDALKGTKYELVSLGADDDASKQAGQIEDLIAQGVKLLLINPVDSTTSGTKIKEANEAGIPVITVDRSSNEGDVKAHIASDNKAGGKMAGEFLKSICPAGNPVLQIEGQPGASAAIDRKAGFEEAFGAANIQQSTAANWNREMALDLVNAFIAAQGNPEGICVFAANDNMALGAVEAIKASPSTKLEKSVVVGFDAIDDAIESINKGELTATIAQQPYEIGKKAGEAAIKYLNGEKVAEFIPVELQLIKKEEEE